MSEEERKVLNEMKEKINRYDLPEEYENAHIGEWIYGVSMIPCYQVVPIIEKLNNIINDMALNIKELAELDYSVEEIIGNFERKYLQELLEERK